MPERTSFNLQDQLLEEGNICRFIFNNYFTQLFGDVLTLWLAGYITILILEGSMVTIPGIARVHAIKAG